jgi:hypothetical protein
MTSLRANSGVQIKEFGGSSVEPEAREKVRRAAARKTPRRRVPKRPAGPKLSVTIDQEERHL